MGLLVLPDRDCSWFSKSTSSCSFRPTGIKALLNCFAQFCGGPLTLQLGRAVLRSMHRKRTFTDLTERPDLG